MDRRLNSTYWLLRMTFGLVPLVAGLDKFLNLLTDWEKYVSPALLSVMPVSATSLMRIAGVVEMLAGVAILAGVTRLGGYVVAAWLVAIAITLLTAGEYLDVAVRDLVMACAAFALARLAEARQPHPADEVRALRTETA